MDDNRQHIQSHEQQKEEGCSLAEVVNNINEYLNINITFKY